MRYFMAVVVFAVWSLAIAAQEVPKAEIFAGYSYGNYELSSGSPSFVIDDETFSGSSSARLGLNGWNASVGVNLNRWFSFVTDFSGYYSGSSTSTTSTGTVTCGSGCTETITTVDTFSSPKIHNFLFGPQFSYPAKKIRPFVQFLAGGQHVDMNTTFSTTTTGCSITCVVGVNPNPEFGHIANTGFAMALGGGVDYSIKHNLAWRLQADYLTNSADGIAQTHVRVSTGVVWRLGL